MDQNQLKQAVAQAAVDYVLKKIDADSIVGIGTGSTANCFIDLIAKHLHPGKLNKFPPHLWLNLCGRFLQFLPVGATATVSALLRTACRPCRPLMVLGNLCVPIALPPESCQGDIGTVSS